VQSNIYVLDTKNQNTRITKLINAKMAKQKAWSWKWKMEK